MRVILREDVAQLGDIGDVVNVKPGYARNFLLPRGLAVVANDRQMKRLTHEQRVIEARVAKARTSAQGVKSKLDKLVLTIDKAAGENDKLFGSVTAMEIDALLRENGFEVDRRKLQMSENIKALGEYPIEIKLHRDVTATIKVNVVAREEPAS
jgi:large subunit ribosomal protein L9